VNVKSEPIMQFFRRQWLPVSAVVLGLVLGRGLRPVPSKSADESLTAATVPQGGAAGAATGGPADDDSAVEAEVARLLGGQRKIMNLLLRYGVQVHHVVNLCM